MNYKEQFIEFINNIDLSLETVLEEVKPDFITELRIKTSYKFLLGDNTLDGVKQGSIELFLKHNITQLDKVKNDFTFKLACKEMKKGLYTSFVQSIIHNFNIQDEDVKAMFFAKYVEIK